MKVALVELRRFQIAAALATAPKHMGLPELALRCAGTFRDSLYGSINPDLAIIGNDPAIALAMALKASRLGQTTLIIPDSLDAADAPSKDYAAVSNNEANCWTPAISKWVSDLLGGVIGEATLARTMLSLAAACSETKQVQILDASMIQSSGKQCRGASGRQLYFPSKQGGDRSTLHPMWKALSRSLPNIRFNGREIEFISARKVCLTTHPSRQVEYVPGMLKAGLFRETRDHRNDWELERLADFKELQDMKI